MTEIIPAIMPKTFEDIEAHAARVRGLVRTVQIDVMDGVFVPPEDWPYTDKESFDRLIAGGGLLPCAGELDYGADLMIKNPEVEIGKWASAGFKRIIVHIESTKDVEAIFDIAGGRVELGISLGTETQNERIYPLVRRADFIQCMGIARIGYQGEPFDERVIPKIRDLRKRYPGVIIQIDGSVNFDTAPRLLEAGANRLVAGSAIWKSGNVAEAIKALQSL